MNKYKLVPAFAFGAIVLGVASAYALTIDGPGTLPGAVTFTANADSSILSTQSGAHAIYPGGTDMHITGTIDSGGSMTFNYGTDVVFHKYEADGFAAQLVVTANGTGSYCPNSGAASLSFATSYIKITKYFNPNTQTSINIALSPCFIQLGTFAPTTGTSVDITGLPFTNGTPKFVATVYMADVSGGVGACPAQAIQPIRNYYGTNSSGNVKTYMYFYSSHISQAFYGTGC